METDRTGMFVDEVKAGVLLGSRAGAAVGTIVEPGGGTAVGAAIGGVLGGAAVGCLLAYNYATSEPEPGCPPCKTVSGKIIPLGTIAYRMDTPSKPQHGIVGTHYNIYKANQIPFGINKPDAKACDCFWQYIDTVRPSDVPPGAIPIEEFAN